MAAFLQHFVPQVGSQQAGSQAFTGQQDHIHRILCCTGLSAEQRPAGKASSRKPVRRLVRRPVRRPSPGSKLSPGSRARGSKLWRLRRSCRLCRRRGCYCSVACEQILDVREQVADRGRTANFRLAASRLTAGRLAGFHGQQGSGQALTCSQGATLAQALQLPQPPFSFMPSNRFRSSAPKPWLHRAAPARASSKTLFCFSSSNNSFTVN